MRWAHTCLGSPFVHIPKWGLVQKNHGVLHASVSPQRWFMGRLAGALWVSGSGLEAKHMEVVSALGPA